MGYPGNRAAGLLVAIALGVLGAVTAATPARAHNSLTGSDPRNGARIAEAPATVRLNFLATLDPQRTKVSITGPDNALAGGKPRFVGAKVTIPFRPGKAGLYIVSYEVGSTDGHPVTGEVRFTVTVGPAVAPTTTPPAGSSVPAPAGTVWSSAGAPSVIALSRSPTVGTSAATASAGAAETESWPWLAAGALLLAGIVAGAALLLRRRATRPD